MHPPGPSVAQVDVPIPLSIFAGVITAFVTVSLSFYAVRLKDYVVALRAVKTELEQNKSVLGKLSAALVNDVQTQHVDTPLEISGSTAVEIRYIVTFPGPVSTSAFEYVKQSGMLLKLPDDLRNELFELYDELERIDRLRQHREDIHYDELEHVHVVIDPAELGLQSKETIYEQDLPPEIRTQLANIRELGSAMEGLDVTILRHIASISSPAMIAEMGLDSVGEEKAFRPSSVEGSAETADVDELIGALDELERGSFMSRLV